MNIRSGYDGSATLEYGFPSVGDYVQGVVEDLSSLTERARGYVHQTLVAVFEPITEMESHGSSSKSITNAKGRRGGGRRGKNKWYPLGGANSKKGKKGKANKK
tara:strand:- start:31 stop:339 length:309 start_codon:yes stop_codon:yes gene_type:complete